MKDSNAADPSRSRQVSWTDPAEFQQAVASGKYRSGLEILEAMRTGELAKPPIAELMGYWPTEFSDGRAVFECDPDESHYNPMGTVHGGLAATLLDTAMACAIHTQLPITTGYTTLELKVNYIRAMTSSTGRVRVLGQVIHCGKRTATADGRIEDAEGRLMAHGSTTCLILG